MSTDELSPGADLFLTVTDRATVPVVAIRGELDQGGESLLPEVVERLVRVSTPIRIVLDLAGVTFMGAAGIRALLLARRVGETAGTALILRSPSSIVRRVLTATGDVRHFAIEYR
jgi:anti-anti-sigma factor